jgi:hypothetical protein
MESLRKHVRKEMRHMRALHRGQAVEVRGRRRTSLACSVTRSHMTRYIPSMMGLEMIANERPNMHTTNTIE